MQCLPETDKVFFVHYQCEKFDDGIAIHNMHIYAKEELHEYTGDNEADFIAKYIEDVNKYCQQGLIPVHWSQNRPYFGPAHIRKRYKELTGKEIDLCYQQGINLSEWLKETYGDDYIAPEHTNRPDRLAELNGFNGHSREGDSNPRIYPGARTLLIHKIYKRARSKCLLTDKATNYHLIAAPQHTIVAEEPVQDIVRKFPDFLLHPDREAFAQALKNEFKAERCKKISLLWHVLNEHTPPLLDLCEREKRTLYAAMKLYFGRDIGAYSTIVDYQPKSAKKTDIDKMKARIDLLLDYMENSNESE
jgi:hypothetical protein